jgi:hypothetical protein
MEIISFIVAGTIILAVGVFFASATILMIAKTIQILRGMRQSVEALPPDTDLG